MSSNYDITDPRFMLEVAVDQYGHQAQMLNTFSDAYIWTNALQVGTTVIPGRSAAGTIDNFANAGKSVIKVVPGSLTEDVARGIGDTYAKLYKEGSLIKYTPDQGITLEIPGNMRLSYESAYEIVAYYEGAHHPMPPELAELVIRSFDPIKVGLIEKETVLSGLALMNQVESNRASAEAAASETESRALYFDYAENKQQAREADALRQHFQEQLEKYTQQNPGFDTESFIKVAHIQYMQKTAGEITDKIGNQIEPVNNIFNDQFSGAEDPNQQSRIQQEADRNDYKAGFSQTDNYSSNINEAVNSKEFQAVVQKVVSGKPLSPDEKALLDAAYNAVKSEYEEAVEIDRSLPDPDQSSIDQINDALVDSFEESRNDSSASAEGVQLASSELQPGMLPRSQSDLESEYLDQQKAAQHGQIFGLSVFTLIDQNNDFNNAEQWAGRSILSTLGENLGEWIHGGSRVDAGVGADGQKWYSDSNEGAWSDFWGELGSNAFSTGVGMIAGEITGNLVEELDWTRNGRRWRARGSTSASAGRSTSGNWTAAISR